MAPSMAACCPRSAARWTRCRVAWAARSSSMDGYPTRYCWKSSPIPVWAPCSPISRTEPMQQEDFRFSTSLRVRWAEVDMQGIVFNGHYLTYADVGITEYFRALR